MALPIDPSEGYMRIPPNYRHDGFAHDGSDGCTRVRPHSGVDATPTVPNSRNRAVLSGTVTRTGFSVYTGNYVEIRDAKGRYWLTFHQRQNLVSAGDIVSAGAIIGYTGNTGGTGALGSVKIGVHNHTSLCATQAASTGLINGRIRERYKNETPAQWAAAHGLLDPWPVIQDSLKDSDKDTNPIEGIEEIDMMKTLAYRRTSTGMTVIANPELGYLWYVSDGGLLNYAKSLGLIDTIVPQELADDAFRALVSFASEGTDKSKQAWIVGQANK